MFESPSFRPRGFAVGGIDGDGLPEYVKQGPIREQRP